MAHRVSVIFDDAVWQQLEEIPRGERSKLLNQAVSESLLKYRRLRAIAALDEVRKSMPRLPGMTERWIRQDRDGHE